MPVIGSAVLLAVTFRTSPDGPVVEATNVSLTITFGSVVVLGPIPESGLTEVGPGRWEYEWTIPLDTPPGTYTAQWSGILPGDTAPTIGYETITVTATSNDDAADDSFVTVDELRDWMNSIGLDADQYKGTQDTLDGLQRELERYCQRRFKVRAYVETIHPDEHGRLWPKNTPVLDVIEPAGLTGHGNQILGGGAFYGAPVVVKYVAGLAPEDAADVRLAIMRVAARDVTDRHDDVLSVRDTDTRRERRADPRVQGWTREELAAFDRLRRRTVA